ncbi:MAG: DUF2007 domain-containing protein [Acidobacteria bacterium]|nr:DUF2007 domain-containing protein [Acidobacteriota bacterium]
MSTSKREQSDEPVTVLESSDPALLAVVKSLFEDAGIEHFAKGEVLQNVFGSLGGFNPVAGPVQLQVPAEDAEEAAALLRDLARDVTPPEDSSRG